MLSVDWVHLWILLSFVFGAWGMYRCARSRGLERMGSVIAGLAFVFAGYASRRAVLEVDAFQGSLWLPVVFLFLSKAFRQPSVRQQLKFTLLAGAAWGMRFLADPSGLDLYIGLTVAFWTLLYLLRPCDAVGRRSALTLFSLLLLAAFLAAAVQLIPAYSYSKMTLRWEGGPFPSGAPVAMDPMKSNSEAEPHSLFSLFFPTGETRDGSDIYFGILPLLLAVYGFVRGKKPDAWRFAALAGFALLVSVSGFVVRGPLLLQFPVVRVGSASAHMLAAFHFGLAMLAGVGAEKLLGELNRGDRRALRKLCRIFGVFVAVTGIVLLGLTLWSVSRPEATVGTTAGYLSRLYYSWLMMLAAWGLLLWRLTRHRSASLFASLILLVMWIDLSAANTTLILPRSAADGKLNYFPKSVYRSGRLMEFVYVLKAEGRWDDEHAVLPPNFQFVHRIRATGGYSTTVPAAYAAFYQREDRVSDQLNVRYQFSRDMVGAPVMIERFSCLPRFQLTRNVKVLPGIHFSDWLEGEAYRPDAVALEPRERDKLPDEVSLLSKQALEVRGQLRVLWENNRRIEMDIENTLPAFLLTSEIYDEGWSAYVDALETPVAKCNGILRGIWLPAGRHRVSFRYLPNGFLQGLTFSSLYWLGLVVALCLFRKRPRMRGQK